MVDLSVLGDVAKSMTHIPVDERAFDVRVGAL